MHTCVYTYPSWFVKMIAAVLPWHMVWAPLWHVSPGYASCL